MDTRFFTACLIALLTAAGATVQGQPRALSDSAEISLVTVRPGDAVYSLFGHSALRVFDPGNDIDLSFSYGTFHFDDPMFVPKFAMGELDYYLSVAYWRNAVRLYRDIEGRPAVQQRLNLTAAERNAFFVFLQENALEENRYYRYDFLFDNCSTRIRDAIESVLENVGFDHEARENITFRQMLHPYLAGTPFLRLGIDLLLGARTDRVASLSERTFLPDFLEQTLDRATIAGPDGNRQPLVAEKSTLISVADYTENKATLPWPAILFSTLAVLVLLKTIRESGRSSQYSSQMFDVVLFGLVGLIGCLLLFMWFGTAHHVTADNWNLAWAWPSHLFFAALLGRVGLTRTLAVYATIVAGASILLIAMWSLVPQNLNEAFLGVCVILAARSAWLALQFRSKRAGAEHVPPAL